MTPRLWGRASSVNVQKVMWVLAECRVDHERIDAGGRYGRTDSPEFAAMNPTRRVPVWQEAGLALCESHAILRHLGRGPAAALWPEGAARAVADQWMEYATNTLMPPLIGVFWQMVRMTPQQRSAEALARHMEALGAATAVLEARLAEVPFLAGEALSLADIAAGTAMYRYHDLEIERPERPALTDWYGRLTERAAYRETVMTSYEELRV